MASTRNWSKKKPKLNHKARLRAANLIAGGMHRSEVQKLLGVNEGTLYRAVPKALVDKSEG
jgi:transposase